MDGRLSAGERERVERHVEGCSRCSEELGSLRDTVSLLRRMPMRSPRRIYTLGEAPSVASTPWRVRVPVWAYGAAASVAIALFALVLSADLSGSLAQDGSGPRVPDRQEAPVVTAQSPEPMPASEAAKAVAVSSPTATPAPQPTPMPEMAAMEAAPAVTPTPQATATPAPQPTSMPEVATMQAAPMVTPTPQVAATPTPQPTSMPEVATMEAAPAGAPTPTATPAPQPTSMPEVATMQVAPAGTPTPQAAAVYREPEETAVADATPVYLLTEAEGVGTRTDTSTPSAMVTRTPVPQSDALEKGADFTPAVPTVTPVHKPTASPSAPTAVAAPTVANQPDRFEQGATPIPTVVLSPIPVPVPTSDSLTEEVPFVEAEDGSTSLVWRVLEGVLGAAAVLLVGGVLWRVRHLPGRNIS